MIVGFIDSVEGNAIRGWVYSPFDNLAPLVTVDGRPVNSLEYPLARGDVAQVLKTDAPTGFKAIAGNVKKDSLIELLVMVEDKIVIVNKFICKEGVKVSSDFKDILAALRISKLKDAVVVTCWDAAHNPIGRAKVLYDIAKTNRPALLASYIFDDFGGKLWEPMQASDIDTLLIPWKQRYIYNKIFHSFNINFDTIWMCKPRLPTFLLSKSLSHSKSALIIDLDDNEEYFSKSKNSENRIYGLGSIGQSRDLLKQVTARTVASISLQSDFGGSLVRHARNQEVTSARPFRQANPRLLFAGTVRPHKGLVRAAKAINLYNFINQTSVEFHVYGDISPLSIKQDLESAGAFVHGVVPQDKLNALVAQFDAVLTGFVEPNGENHNITKYQITSKIGDALSVSRPVLVPFGPSVEDLQNLEGIFLFNENNFMHQLTTALNFQGEAKLPDEFTTDGAYKAFLAAEELSRVSAKALEVFSTVGGEKIGDKVEYPLTSRKPTMILLWKQQDAGIYGRRVDQLARAYHAKYPEHRIIVLQFCHENVLKDLRNRSENIYSEAGLILRRIQSYARAGYGGYIENGIQYDLIAHQTDSSLSEEFIYYLTHLDIHPDNTTVVLFPLVPALSYISSVLQSFPVIVDVVDNQLSWAASAKKGKNLLEYYNHLLLSNKVIFNSEENRKYFTDNIDLIEKNHIETKVVENWYYIQDAGDQNTLPFTVSKNEFNLIYSGNLNDRIDFDLIMQISQLIQGVKIHIFGTAERAPQAFKDVCSLENVTYYGPRPEKEIVLALSSMNLAIMPHIDDHVSKFMNPMKVKMYDSFGIMCISTKIKGVASSDTVVICESKMEFLNQISMLRDQWALTETRSTQKSIKGNPLPKQHTPDEFVVYDQTIDSIRELWGH